MGSAICKAALAYGAHVTSVSRSGTPSLHLEESIRSRVVWHSASVGAVASDLDDLTCLLEGATGVVSTVGSFGEPLLNNQSMFDINGMTNANIAQHASDCGVRNFVFISAHQYPLVKHTVLGGYYRGKVHAENVMSALPFEKTTILRPGFISGTRGNIPLYMLGNPMAAMLRSAPSKSLRSALPAFFGDFLETPIDIHDVALCAAAGGLGMKLPLIEARKNSYLCGGDMAAVASELRFTL